jgi:hypothetical protein
MKLAALALFLAATLCAQSPATLSGYAWSAEGRPLPGAHIALSPAGSQDVQTINVGKDGAFTVRDLKPGSYVLTANAPAEQLQTESGTTIEIKPGETLHADLTLGKSTVHHGFWSRLVRRVHGLYD